MGYIQNIVFTGLFKNKII